MNDEALLITQAIESLRDTKSVFHDYLFPIVTGFFSAILGAWVAYWTLRYQENFQLEKEKLQIANKWTISVEGMISSLIAYKQNYFGEVNDDPIKRTLSVRSLINDNTPISDNLAELSFITPNKEDKSSRETKWRSLPRIRGMINNYNLILRIIEIRNEKERPIRELLIANFGNRGVAEMTHEQILSTLEDKGFLGLVDLTEKLIHLIDDILLEANSFLEEFPDVAKSVIDTNKTKRYGRVLSFDAKGNEYIGRLLKKCPEVDYSALAKLYGMKFEEVVNFYDNGYRWEDHAL